MRYFRVDLLDLWRNRLSYRRLAVLIRHLPADSWTQTALRDATEHELVEVPDDGAPRKFGPWALEHYQLADVADEIAALRYVLIKAHGGDAPEPHPRPRPGLNRNVRRQSAAAVAYLKRLRNRGD